MIEYFLLTALMNAIAILGMHTFLNGESWVAGLIRKAIPKPLIAPFFDCEMCMSSIWGIAGFYVIYSLFGSYVLASMNPFEIGGMLVMHILTVCGLMRLYVDWYLKDG